MSNQSPADVISVVNNVNQKLESAYDEIVRRQIESEAVENVLSTCNEDYLTLIKSARAQLARQGRTEEEKDLSNQLQAVIKGLQTVRETLGQLARALDARADLAEQNKAPPNFERSHGKAETAIQELFIAIDILLENHGGPIGSHEPSHGGRAEPRPSDDVDDKYQYWKIHPKWISFG
jgi:hypothetical protein